MKSSNAAASLLSSFDTTKLKLYRAIDGLTGSKEVEALIHEKLTSEAPLLSEISNYLLELGGKRIRPTLAILTAATLGMKQPSQALLDVSAGIELIHMATLLHDDIIDHSPLRRRKISPFEKYGLPNTLLTGDFLLVRAFSLCARLDRCIIDWTEVACVELTEGEISETSLAESAHTLETSLSICRKKTAALFRLAALSGAHVARGVDEVTQHFGAFGEDLGIAFQIMDDVLDVTSEEKTFGKMPGIDLRERKPSIVNVLWLASGSSLAQELLKNSTATDDSFVEQALHELKTGPVIESAKELARSYAEKAEKSLETALSLAGPVDQVKADGMRALIQYCLERLE